MALYELRTYTLRVGAMAEAVKLYQELGFPALQKGGQDKKLVGYFQADTGTINQLVHLWKFDDDADRRAHWAAVYCEQGFRRGFRLEVPPTADDPGGEAPPGRAVGTASLTFWCSQFWRLSTRTKSLLISIAPTGVWRRAWRRRFSFVQAFKSS